MQVNFGLFPLILFPVLFILSFKWPSPKQSVEDISQVKTIKRLIAFVVDMYVAMIGVLPIICMPSLLIEYMWTGEWVWSFERNFFRSTDFITTLFFIIGLAGFFYYWIWHAKNKKQTFGQRFLKFGP